ncbi:MAG: hypothetical protein H7835_21045, partial [Magnetococcus sp. XQGC-1]
CFFSMQHLQNPHLLKKEARLGHMLRCRRCLKQNKKIFLIFFHSCILFENFGSDYDTFCIVFGVAMLLLLLFPS